MMNKYVAGTATLLMAIAVSGYAHATDFTSMTTQELDRVQERAQAGTLSDEDSAAYQADMRNREQSMNSKERTENRSGKAENGGNQSRAMSEEERSARQTEKQDRMQSMSPDERTDHRTNNSKGSGSRYGSGHRARQGQGSGGKGHK